MAENKHLTPTAIVYVDGKRMDTEHEGALKQILIKDMLNNISSFSLVFDNAHTKIADKDLFALESEVSIHLGYKDDVEEVFSGDVLTLQVMFPEYGTEEYEISGCNVLHRLKHGEHCVSYEQMNPSDIIKKMIDHFSLKAKIEDFGTVAEFSSNDGYTVYDYLLHCATSYGKEFYADKDTIYIANEITIRNDEIILEWGKSLISFKEEINIERLVSGYDYIGWDTLNGESFTGSASMIDLPVKVGGDADWTTVYRGGNDSKFRSQLSEMGLKDAADAKQRAIGMLQKNSFWFSQARGKCEGNYKIRPGMRVTVKMVGTMSEGEYIAEEVIHKFSYDEGYTTTVGLKRNMILGTGSTGLSEMQKQQAAEAMRGNIRAIQKHKSQVNSSESGNFFQIGNNVSGETNFVDEMSESSAENIQTKETEPTSYSMSENGKTLLKKLEGSVKNEEGLLIPYNDSNGHATKGYGIKLHNGPLTEADIANNVPQTEEQASADFNIKIVEYEGYVNNRASYTFPNGVQTLDVLSLTQTQADALISLTYNSPETGKNVMNAIRAGKTQEEIKTIWMGGYTADSGVGKRRISEWKLYSEGVYAENPYE